MSDPLATIISIASPAPSRAVGAEPAPRLERAAPRVMRARYDAAQTNDENRRHWAMTDSMSARQANSAEVRHRLRNRARYETANNSYLKGIVETLANDTIGTGPRLQLNTDDDGTNRAIEGAFAEWAKAVFLAEKLHTMRMSRAVDGEAFLVFVNNPLLDNPVQLDLKIIEADQVTTLGLNPIDPLAVDGLRLDEAGNVVEFHLLRQHPGDPVPLLWVYDRIPARLVIHWFKPDRPHQFRGIPEIMPALPLTAQLRRFTLAVLAAAETAADFAAVLESNLPPDSDVEQPEQDFLSMEIERRMMTTIPAGWKMNQFTPQQPATTYKEFKGEILNEIGRCLNMPFNVVAGNSSSYNYASGRLDHQVYYKSIHIDQSGLKLKVLDRIFRAWLDEASLVTDIVPDGPGRIAGWPHQWFFDGHGHVDPEKEANAQQTRLQNYTTTYADEYARAGQDWEVQFRQIAKEQALKTALGIMPAPVSPSPSPKVPVPNPGDSNADPEEAD